MKIVSHLSRKTWHEVLLPTRLKVKDGLIKYFLSYRWRNTWTRRDPETSTCNLFWIARPQQSRACWRSILCQIILPLFHRTWLQTNPHLTSDPSSKEIGGPHDGAIWVWGLGETTKFDMRKEIKIFVWRVVLTFL